MRERYQAISSHHDASQVQERGEYLQEQPIRERVRDFFRTVRERVWDNKTNRKIAAGALACASVATGIGIHSSVERGDVLSARARMSACEDAGVQLMNGGSVRLEGEQESKTDAYHLNLDTKKAKDALKQAEGVLYLTDLRTIDTPPHVTLDEIANIEGQDIAALECLNGIRRTAQTLPNELQLLQQYHDDANVVVRKDTNIDVLMERTCPKVDGVRGEYEAEPKPGMFVARRCQDAEKAEVSKKHTLETFVAHYGSYAREAEEKYGVPHEVSLAIASLRSNNGTTKLAEEGFNYHGLPAKKEWQGDAIEHQVKRKIPKKLLKQYDTVGDVVDLNKTTVEATVRERYRKYASERDGFFGFVHYLRQRDGGAAYQDVFKYSDPDEFFDAMMDDVGSKYATSDAYNKKIHTRIAAIKKAEMHEISEIPAIETHARIDTRIAIPKFKSLSHIQRDGFRNTTKNRSPEEAYEHTMRTVQSVELSKEGYEEFNKNTYDDASYLTKRGLASRMYNPSKKMRTKKPAVVAHYTAWRGKALNHNAGQFITSMESRNRARMQRIAAHGYIARDGTTSGLAFNGMQLNHAKGISGESYGIEIAASTQDDVSSEQYTSLAYLAARIWREQNPNQLPKNKQEIRDFLWGHGEVTEKKGKGTHVDFPEVVVDAVADKMYGLLKESDDLPVLPQLPHKNE